MKLRPPILATFALTLVLGAGGVVQWWIGSHAGTRPKYLPALSRDQLGAIPTFERWCSRQDECEPPLSCVLDQRVRGRRCLGNECNSDAECEAGSVCRALPAEGPPVRLCVVKGVREEGERCAAFPLKPHEACGGALLCNRTFCGRRCRLDSPTSCPRGFACLENGEMEPSCVPDCQRYGCPAGKRCFLIKKSFSVCGVLGDETDCEAQPCPPEQKCRKTLDDLSDAVYMRCYRPCDVASQCPPGDFCAYGTCVTECDQAVRGSCGPNRGCVHDPRLRKAFCIGE